MDKVLSDDGDHSETGIVLLVGGLQMRERWYSHCVGREKKGKKKTPFQKNVSKELYNSYLHFVLKYEPQIPMRNPLWYLLIISTKTKIILPTNIFKVKKLLFVEWDDKTNQNNPKWHSPKIREIRQWISSPLTCNRKTLHSRKKNSPRSIN